MGVASRAVWRRVWDRGATYAQHAVAWRILHGALMVGAYKLRVAPYLPVEAAYCTCCAAAGRPGRLETLTHAFMECPAVAPALDWLLAVYGALTGSAPPRDALVVLADADWFWAPPDRTLWTRMRLAFLGVAWQVRCRGFAAPDPAAAARTIVERVVRTLESGVRRDWVRVTTDPVQLAVGLYPTTWFVGPRSRLTEQQFRDLWPDAGGWYEAAAGAAVAHVRLSSSWPVVYTPVAGPGF